MATTEIDRSDIGSNDTGGGTDGTVVDTTYIALAIYDKIDALIANQLNFGSHISVAATKKIYVDGGGDTFLSESSANNLRVTAGGATVVDFATAGVTASQPVSVIVNLTGALAALIRNTHAAGYGLKINAASDATRYALNVVNFDDSVGFFTIKGDGQIETGTAAKSPYNNTTASAANVFVDSSGVLFRSTSSRRYKSAVRSFRGGLADVLKLRPVSFTDKHAPKGRRHLGFIAEDLDAAGFTEVVTYDAQERPDAIQYDRLTTYLVNAIRELHRDVTALKAA